MAAHIIRVVTTARRPQSALPLLLLLLLFLLPLPLPLLLRLLLPQNLRPKKLRPQKKRLSQKLLSQKLLSQKLLSQKLLRRWRKSDEDVDSITDCFLNTIDTSTITSKNFCCWPCSCSCCYSRFILI